MKLKRVRQIKIRVPELLRALYSGTLLREVKGQVQLVWTSASNLGRFYVVSRNQTLSACGRESTHIRPVLDTLRNSGGVKWLTGRNVNITFVSIVNGPATHSAESVQRATYSYPGTRSWVASYSEGIYGQIQAIASRK